MSTQKKYTALLVGCGRMGAGQARHINKSPCLTLVGVSDPYEPNLTKVSQEHNVPGFINFGEALRALNPEVVIICTGNMTHASLTLESANYPSVKAIYCEKPMAVNLKDARKMVEVCKVNGKVLSINHQRRVTSGMIAMKSLIDSGAIGEVKSIRLHNAGDLLSDGTHAIDSLMYLANDCGAEWVIGQVHYEPKPEAGDKKEDTKIKFQRGHVLESGLFGIIKLTNGWRAEIFNGDLVPVRSPYQEYIVEGDKGRLWRTGDTVKPNLFIQDANGGDWMAGIDQWMYKPVPSPSAQVANYGWRPIEGQMDDAAIVAGYQAMIAEYETGTPSPLKGAIALKGFETVMALYESARINRKVTLPLKQDRFPLELMFEEGQFE